MDFYDQTNECNRNILIIGSGGREASIVKKLVECNCNIYCIGTNKNPMILDVCKKFSLFKNINEVVLLCKSKNINLVVIGPEKYLELGLIDELKKNNIKCIGPSQKLAQIETNKYYSRELLKNNNLDQYNPSFKLFTNLDLENLKTYIDYCKNLDMNYVIKPIGLCSGKGVYVSNEHFFSDLEGLTYAISIITRGSSFIIEEKFIGDEFTLMCYTDGDTISYMPLVQDFKRLESNTGPNTGSMGCISYSNGLLPFITIEDLNISKQILDKTIKVLQKNENELYQGILYGSFIKCKDGIKVIEFNSRYGDPECINILELLETNLLDIYFSIVNKTLKDIKITYSDENMVSKYIVPYNYPICNSNNTIVDIEWYNKNRFNCICSSVNLINNEIHTTNSRTMIYFNKGMKSINDLSININKNIVDLINSTNNTNNNTNNDNKYKYRQDIGINNSSISYKNSGVNIDNANIVLSKIKTNIENTFNTNTLNKFGDYAGLFNLSNFNYKEPVLVSSIDGVGTKISFLHSVLGSKSFKNVGVDIVNHSINDILVKGAKPLFFLDYLGSKILVPENISDIVESISIACKKNNCVLIGGETAEMSCTYMDNEIDIVGCMIGIVEKSEIIDGPKNILSEDIIIGLPSEGLHTNGYTLIRDLVSKYNISSDLKQWLCQSHKSYLDEINLLTENNIKILGLSHITGGGLVENPKRVISEYLKLVLNKSSLMNKYFKEIQTIGNITNLEMYRTFNCGIGMMIFISSNEYSKVEEIFNKNNINFVELGIVKYRNKNEDQIQFI